MQYNFISTFLQQNNIWKLRLVLFKMKKIINIRLLIHVPAFVSLSLESKSGSLEDASKRFDLFLLFSRWLCPISSTLQSSVSLPFYFKAFGTVVITSSWNFMVWSSPCKHPADTPACLVFLPSDDFTPDWSFI